MSEKLRNSHAITVYKPKSDDVIAEEELTDGKRCLCCGEPTNTAGMCTSCSWADCPIALGKKCKRTGVVDPLGLDDPLR